MRVSALALLIAGSAIADPVVSTIYLAEDNFTNGFLAPGRISVNTDKFPFQTGFLLLCEKFGTTGCDGAPSDIVVFDNQTRNITLKSDVDAVNPTEGSGDPADSGFSLPGASDKVAYALEDASGVASYTPSVQKVVDPETGMLISFDAQPGYALDRTTGNPSDTLQFVYAISSDPPEPTPEPSTTALIGLGILSLAMYGRRAFLP